jgi:hypothetical protein
MPMILMQDAGIHSDWISQKLQSETADRSRFRQLMPQRNVFPISGHMTRTCRL